MNSPDRRWVIFTAACVMLTDALAIAVIVYARSQRAYEADLAVAMLVSPLLFLQGLACLSTALRRGCGRWKWFFLAHGTCSVAAAGLVNCGVFSATL